MSQTWNTNTFRAAALICHELGTPIAVMQSWGSLKKRPMVKARQALIVRLRRLGHSFPRIGAVLSMDHTTILLAERRELRAGQ